MKVKGKNIVLQYSHFSEIVFQIAGEKIIIWQKKTFWHIWSLDTDFSLVAF
jgi:hypothetical protein